jgi:hypothetical protein
MDPNRLAEHYSSMQTDELVALYNTGTLTEDAYPILEAELGRRSIVAGPRPPPPVYEGEPPFFSGHWHGLYPAASANGFVTGLVPALLAFAFWLTDKLARHFMPNVGVVTALRPTLAVLMLAYLVFATVAVWRCARSEASERAVTIARFTGLKKVAVFALLATLVLANRL